MNYDHLPYDYSIKFARLPKVVFNKGSNAQNRNFDITFSNPFLIAYMGEGGFSEAQIEHSFLGYQQLHDALGPEERLPRIDRPSIKKFMNTFERSFDSPDLIIADNLDLMLWLRSICDDEYIRDSFYEIYNLLTFKAGQDRGLRYG
jgi:hypothetical protein